MEHYSYMDFFQYACGKRGGKYAFCAENEEDFLNNIIQTSIKEYSARAKEVYSGKTVDPEHSDYFQIEHKEDVFGDEVATGISYAYYTLTYRILDADELTVGERE